jgi:5-aminolevulinate synthase
LASIRHLKDSAAERDRVRDRVARVRSRLDSIGIPCLKNSSHIVPVMVGDPVRCKHISDRLLENYDIYVQPINYPTVPRGTERLRITPSPFHTDADIDHLARSLSAVWSDLPAARVDVELEPKSIVLLEVGGTQLDQLRSRDKEIAVTKPSAPEVAGYSPTSLR